MSSGASSHRLHISNVAAGDLLADAIALNVDENGRLNDAELLAFIGGINYKEQLIHENLRTLPEVNRLGAI
jgi:hypothetical protein